MTDWRDEASDNSDLSDEVRDDFDRLAEVTIAAARNFLEESGDFIPFPMVIKADGELSLIGLDQPRTEQVPQPDQVVRGIVDLFRDRRDSIRALAIGIDVAVPAEATDGIEVHLEHRDGASIILLVPYQIDPLDDTYQFDESRVRAGERAIWG